MSRKSENKGKNKSKRLNVRKQYYPESSDSLQDSDEYTDYERADQIKEKPKSGKKRNNPSKIKLKRGEIHKPYMFLVRLGINDREQKLAVRQTMSQYEYMTAFTYMLYQEEVVLEGEIEDYLKHLHSIISECQMGTNWDIIRMWSQEVLDKVESGDLSWDNVNSIECLLMKMKITPMNKPAVQTPINLVSSNQHPAPEKRNKIRRDKEEKKERICKD